MTKQELVHAFAKSIPNAVKYEWNRTRQTVTVYFDNIHKIDFKESEIVKGDVRFCDECGQIEEK